MSSASTGTAFEYAVVDAFIAEGFVWMRSHLSGQSIEPTRAAAHLPGDVLVYRGIPPIPSVAFQIECGGKSKPIAKTFAALRARLLPGFAPMVVRAIRSKGKKTEWRVYVDEDSFFGSVREALEAL
jgi:hypothetical protein